MHLQRKTVWTAAAVAILGFGLTARAATVASDKASNSTYSTTYAGLNGGTGFGAWSVTDGATGSNGIGASSSGSGVLNFLVGETSSTTEITTATRPFTGTLSAGQVFSTDTTLGSSSTGALLGFSLEDASGNVLFDEHSTGGGNQALYSDKTATNQNITGVRYNFSTTDTFAFTLLDSAGDYSLTVTGSSTSGNGVIGGTSTITGTINNAVGISKIVYYNQGTTSGGGAANGEQFTNLSIANTPEPASLALIGLTGLGFLLRRRRAALSA